MSVSFSAGQSRIVFGLPLDLADWSPLAMFSVAASVPLPSWDCHEEPSPHAVSAKLALECAAFFPPLTHIDRRSPKMSATRRELIEPAQLIQSSTC